MLAVQQAAVADNLNGMSKSRKFDKEEARFWAAFSNSVNGNGTHLRVHDVEDGAYHFFVVVLSRGGASDSSAFRRTMVRCRCSSRSAPRAGHRSYVEREGGEARVCRPIDVRRSGAMVVEWPSAGFIHRGGKVRPARPGVAE